MSLHVPMYSPCQHTPITSRPLPCHSATVLPYLPPSLVALCPLCPLSPPPQTRPLPPQTCLAADLLAGVSTQFMQCGESRSAVEVSNCNTPPPPISPLPLTFSFFCASRSSLMMRFRVISSSLLNCRYTCRTQSVEDAQSLRA